MDDEDETVDTSDNDERLDKIVRMAEIEDRMTKGKCTQEDLDFLKAYAEQDRCPKAAVDCGEIYLFGLLGPVDQPQAFKYLDIAQEEGDWKILAELSTIYTICTDKTDKADECMKASQADYEECQQEKKACEDDKKEELRHRA